jgi:hypothetical protein
VGPRAGVDVCEKSRPHRDSIPGPSSPWPVATPTEPSRLPDYLKEGIILLLLILYKFFSSSRYFLSRRSNYSPQQTVSNKISTKVVSLVLVGQIMSHI